MDTPHDLPLSQPVVDTRGWFRRMVDGLFGVKTPAKREFDRVINGSTTVVISAREGGERRHGERRHGDRRHANPGLIILAVVLSMALAGCSVQEQYVDADELTYNAIAPDYLKLVEASDRSDAEKELARLTVESWAARIKQAKTKSEDQ